MTGKSRANIKDSVWTFTSRVKCPVKNKDTPTPWYAEIKIKIQADDSAPNIKIDSVSCEDADSFEIKRGTATVRFPADVRQAKISGTTLSSSLPIFGHRAPIKIAVTGGKEQVKVTANTEEEA